MKKSLTVAFILLLLGVLQSSRPAVPVAACECPDWPTPQGALDKAELAFSGKVLTVTPIDGTGDDLVTFAVNSTWKASASAQVQVFGPPFCEAEFQVGQSYLIYATHLSTDLQKKFGLNPGSYLEPVPCNRTQTLAGAGTDLAALGAGAASQQAPPGLPTTGHATDSTITWLMIAALLVLGSKLRRARERS